MKRWVKVAASVLGVLVVAQILVLGYWWTNALPENADNNYQRIILTDVEKGQTQDGVVTAEIRAEPYLYCPGTESFPFRISASFYNDSELIGSGVPDGDHYTPFSVSDVGVPRDGINVSIMPDNESLSPNTVDAIRVLAVNRGDRGAPPCNEIAFPDELPPREYRWNSTNGGDELEPQQNSTAS